MDKKNAVFFGIVAIFVFVAAIGIIDNAARGILPETEITETATPEPTTATSPDIMPVSVTAPEPLWNPDTHANGYCEGYCWEGICPFFTGYPEREPIGQRSSFKSWMDFRMITNRTSRQWELQQHAYTDDNGFRRHGDLYMVAVGTYFLENGVGDILEITFSTGDSIRAVVGDVKDDRHTCEYNRESVADGSVVEFIVDRRQLDRMAVLMGCMTYAGMVGEVMEITREVQTP
jgi:hypothetical protein